MFSWICLNWLEFYSEVKSFLNLVFPIAASRIFGMTPSKEINVLFCFATMYGGGNIQISSLTPLALVHSI